jgi:uncharacterized protein VirK/YbjX
MILIRAFLAKEIIHFLESEFISHEPQMQEAFMNDVAHEVKLVTEWVNEKISKKQKQG